MKKFMKGLLATTMVFAMMTSLAGCGGDAATDDSADADASAEDKDAAAETETIKLTDLKEGDVVKIVLDADGNAKSITVIAEAPKAEDKEEKKDDAKADDTKSDDRTDDASADTAEADTEAAK